MTKRDEENSASTKTPGRATSEGIGPAGRAALASVGTPPSAASTIVPTGDERDDDDDGGELDLFGALGESEEKSDDRDGSGPHVVLGGSTATRSEALGHGNEETTKVTTIGDLMGAVGDLTKRIVKDPSSKEDATSPQPAASTSADVPPATSSTELDTGDSATVKAAKALRARDTAQTGLRKIAESIIDGTDSVGVIIEASGGHLWASEALWLALTVEEERREMASTPKWISALRRRRLVVLVELAERGDLTAKALAPGGPLSGRDVVELYDSLIRTWPGMTDMIRKEKTEQALSLLADAKEVRSLIKEGVKVEASTPLPVSAPADSMSDLGTAPTVAADNNLAPGPVAPAAASSLASPPVVKASGLPPGTPSAGHAVVPDSVAASARRVTPPRPIAAVDTEATTIPDLGTKGQTDDVWNKGPWTEADRRTFDEIEGTLAARDATSPDAQKTDRLPRVSTKELRPPRNRTALFVLLAVAVAAIVVWIVASVKQHHSGDTVVAPTTGVDKNCIFPPVTETEQRPEGQAGTQWTCIEQPPIVQTSKGGQTYEALKICPPNCTRLSLSDARK